MWLCESIRPGITVRPLMLMDGGHEVNEVFFDNVRVPVANLLGPNEGRGFKQLVANLPRERLSIALGAVAGSIPVTMKGAEPLRDTPSTHST